MTKAEKKNKILGYLAIEKHRNGFWKIDDVSGIVGCEVSYHEGKSLLEEMAKEGHVKLSDLNFGFLHQGLEFFEHGGYTALEQREQEQKVADELREQLSLEKLRYEVKNAKRIYKTYWWTFGFALAALGISLINLAYQLFKKVP